MSYFPGISTNASPRMRARGASSRQAPELDEDFSFLAPLIFQDRYEEMRRAIQTPASQSNEQSNLRFPEVLLALPGLDRSKRQHRAQWIHARRLERSQESIVLATA